MVVSALTPLPGRTATVDHQAARIQFGAVTPDAVNVSLGASEVLPMIAIVPFMLYQLAGHGTLHFVVSKSANWVINIAILGMIVPGYVAYREGGYVTKGY